MSTPISIALAQLELPVGDADANREATVRAAREAFDAGADLVILPELAVPGYTTSGRALAPYAEGLDGATVSAWTSVATEADGYVVGGFCERDGDGLYNTAVCVGPEGLVLHYRKLHLFDTEKIDLRPGDVGLPVADTRFGRIGICVCYDLRFPEVVRILALKGAALVCVPTAWIAGFDQVQWDDEGMCPQAKGAVLQSNLSQVFIACASQVGATDRYVFLGSSVLADPYGNRLLGPFSGSASQLELATVDIDDAQRAQVRGELIKPRQERRRDVYGLAIDDTVL